jgi:predicted nucleotidyltransferase
VSADLPATIVDRVAEQVRLLPGVDVLMLFGSRARGEAGAGSDWDFGYLASPALDLQGLIAILTEAVGSDRVDAVDLQRASGLLRYRAARDGVVLVETAPGTADRFRLEAARFWYDAAPILERGYRDVLAELGP